MEGGRVFVDTNVIVYAYDSSAGEKHRAARSVMKDLWDSGRGVTSTQVLAEFFVTVTGKIARPMSAASAREIVKDLLKWKTVVVDGGTILEAMDIHAGHKYSFWDSLIIAAAAEGGAGTLLTEDLSDRHKVSGVVIKNPFKV